MFSTTQGDNGCNLCGMYFYVACKHVCACTCMGVCVHICAPILESGVRYMSSVCGHQRLTSCVFYCILYIFLRQRVFVLRQNLKLHDLIRLVNQQTFGILLCLPPISRITGRYIPLHILQVKRI